MKGEREKRKKKKEGESRKEQEGGIKKGRRRDKGKEKKGKGRQGICWIWIVYFHLVYSTEPADSVIGTVLGVMYSEVLSWNVLSLSLFEPMYYIFSTLIITVSQPLVSLSFYAALYKTYLHTFASPVFSMTLKTTMQDSTEYSSLLPWRLSWFMTFSCLLNTAVSMLHTDFGLEAGCTQPEEVLFPYSLSGTGVSWGVAPLTDLGIYIHQGASMVSTNS